MSAAANYYAHGHRSQDAAYAWLFGAPPERVELENRIFGVGDSLGDFAAARPSPSPGIGGLFAGFHLADAVIACLPEQRTLLLRRPELRHRAGVMRECIRASEPGACALRYLAAAAPQPDIDATSRAHEQFGARCEVLSRARPLAALLDTSRSGAAQFRPRLAQALAAFAARDPGAHLALLLPAEADLPIQVLALALALDELLPLADKQRGYVACTGAVAQADRTLTQMSFTILAPAPGLAYSLLPKSVQIHTCDLRQAKPADELTAAFETLLAAGPEFAAALAEWLRRQPQRSLADLPAAFWQSLVLRRQNPAATAEQLLRNLDQPAIDHLELTSFLGLWQALAGQPEAQRQRGRAFEKIAARVKSNPAWLGWILQPEVLADHNLAATAQKYLREAYLGAGEGLSSGPLDARRP